MNINFHCIILVLLCPSDIYILLHNQNHSIKHIKMPKAPCCSGKNVSLKLERKKSSICPYQVFILECILDCQIYDLANAMLNFLCFY